MFTAVVLLNNMLHLKPKICLTVASEIRVEEWVYPAWGEKCKIKIQSSQVLWLWHTSYTAAERSLVISHFQGKGFREWVTATCFFKLCFCHSFCILLQSFYPFKEVTLFGITCKIGNLSFINFLQEFPSLAQELISLSPETIWSETQKFLTEAEEHFILPTLSAPWS